MAQCLIILVLILSAMLGRAVYAADPGDNVLFTGEDELSVTILKEGVNRVLTEASSVSERVPVLLATTENITLFGEQVIDQPIPEEEEDEPTPTNLSRVLVWRQIDATENGIYATNSGAWARATDADDAAELINHFSVYVQSGVIYGQTQFRLTTTGTITLGTTPILFTPMPKPPLLPLTSLPSDPAIGTTYTVSAQDGTCQADGLLTGPCWWDGGSWQPMGSGGGSLATLDSACASGTDCAVTNLTAARPFIRAGPSALAGTFLRDYFESGNPIEECLDPTTGVFCQPAYQRLYPDQEQCLIMAILDDPPTEVCLESVQNIGVGGIGTSLLWSDRGLFANRPADPYTDQTYLVTNCLTAGCTAGGGTTRVWQQWTGSAWVNLTGTAAAGDIEAVWGCSSGGCNTLTAASGDTLNATSADSVIPQPVTATLPVGACTEGMMYHDTNSGGSETYKCTATNTWTKLQAVLDWEIPFSAAGLTVDGTNCVLSAATQINSGPLTRPIICADAPGTLELSFLSPTRWDGTTLTVKFIMADTTSSSMVWSVNVEAMCRTIATDTINNTWGTAVAATSAAMATANVPYVAQATITPNTGCAGGDLVFIKATVLSASTHTDSSARVFGGSVSGGQL